MTKYQIPDGHEWADEQTEDFAEQPVPVTSHDVEIIHTTDPTEDMGYGRDKYTVHLAHDDREHTPYAVFATKWRWKGNFWRESLEVDWRDLPNVVQRRAASVIACESVADLDPGTRVIEPEGRDPWRERECEDTGDSER